MSERRALKGSVAVVLVTLVTAVALTSVAAGGLSATKQRVAIETKILPQGTFVLTPLQAGPVKRDSGTVAGNWRSVRGREVIRNGRKITIYSTGVWTLTGKQGVLTIRERNEWVAVGYDDGVATAPGRSCGARASTPSSPGAEAVAMPVSVPRGTRATRASSPRRNRSL